jgi:hypothetical protein
MAASLQTARIANVLYFRIYKNASASLSNSYAATTNLQNGKMGSSKPRRDSTPLLTPISEAERVSKEEK